MGESIAPFRVLSSRLGIIPYRQRVLDSDAAGVEGFPNLADWLSEAESKWSQFGSGDMTLVEQLDYYGKLSSQFPLAPIRLVYAKAGTLPAAAIVMDEDAVIDHKLYWMRLDSIEEGHFLATIINSETARKAAEHLQSRGQWGARDFDKVMFTLPIPRFDPSIGAHRAIVSAGEKATECAETVELDRDMYFTTARKRIRDALKKDGVSKKIEALVSKLLEV